MLLFCTVYKITYLLTYLLLLSVCRSAAVRRLVGDARQPGRGSSARGPGVRRPTRRRLLRRQRSTSDVYVPRGARHPDQRQVWRTVDQSHTTG